MTRDYYSSFLAHTAPVSTSDTSLEDALADLAKLDEKYHQIMPGSSIPSSEMIIKLATMCGIGEGVSARTPMPTLVNKISTRAKIRLQQLKQQQS